MSGSRIAASFAAAERALLVPYLTAGWPKLDSTAALMKGLEDSGADLIELGVPFSDPSADGPVIQRANEEALANGSGLATAIEATAGYRERGGTLPVVLMGYANPFMRMGPAQLAAACRQAGVDGVLAVDWPPAPGDELGTALSDQGVDRIVMVAPTTTMDKARAIAAAGSGYVYYVSFQGVTGAQKLDAAAVAAAGPQLREATGLPVAVGFGVRTPQDCAALAQAFDAVVVGTRLIKTIGESEQAARRLIAAMKEALA